MPDWPGYLGGITGQTPCNISIWRILFLSASFSITRPPEANMRLAPFQRDQTIMLLLAMVRGDSQFWTKISDIIIPHLSLCAVGGWADNVPSSPRRQKKKNTRRYDIFLMKPIWIRECRSVWESTLNIRFSKTHRNRVFGSLKSEFLAIQYRISNNELWRDWKFSFLKAEFCYNWVR